MPMWVTSTVKLFVIVVITEQKYDVAIIYDTRGQTGREKWHRFINCHIKVINWPRIIALFTGQIS